MNNRYYLWVRGVVWYLGHFKVLLSADHNNSDGATNSSVEFLRSGLLGICAKIQ